MLQEHRKYLTYYNVLGKKNPRQKMSELPSKFILDLLLHMEEAFAICCHKH